MAGDAEGRADLEEALSLGLELGLGNETAIAYDNLADWVSSLDGAAAGLAVYEEGMAFAERRGLGGNRMWMRAESTWRLFDLGRWDDVTAAAEEIRQWFSPRGRGLPVVMSGTQDGRVRAYRGDLGRAAELMDELLPAARESKDIQAYRPALTTAALIEVERGHPQAAAALLDELEDDLEGGGYNRAYGMLEGTLVARALGDTDRAERIARVEEPFVPGYPLGKALMLASQAEVAEAQGRYDDALEAFDRAEGVWEGLGHVFHRGLAWLGAARCLSALKRPREASEPAASAQRVLLSLGALSMAGEAAAMVRNASSASS